LSAFTLAAAYDAARIQVADLENRRNAAERKVGSDLVWKNGVPFNRVTKRRVYAAKNESDPEHNEWAERDVYRQIVNGYPIARSRRRDVAADEPDTAPCAWCGEDKNRRQADDPLCTRCSRVEVAERRRAGPRARAKRPPAGGMTDERENPAGGNVRSL
jgi:hypothetical protein